MKRIIIFIVFSFIVDSMMCQNVGINSTGATPDASALLDLSSTNKGFLITRVDTVNIISPAFGLMTLAPVDSCLYMFNGVNWVSQGGVGKNCPSTRVACTLPSVASSGTHIESDMQIVWNWLAVGGATGYKWNTVNDYTTAIDNANAISYTQTGLSPSTNYTLYVWAYNSCGTAPVTILIASTCALPNVVTQITGSNGYNFINWNWNIVVSATGYKWNTVNNYASATDLGNVISFTQTGLTSNTSYTIYVWAYNLCGASSVSIFNSSTIAQQVAYTTPGTFTWICPPGVTSVSVVCVGGGAGGNGWDGGGGAGLGWKNNIVVVPGNPYTVVVGAGGVKPANVSAFFPGGDSYFINVATVKGGGAPNANGGGFVGNGGGNGGVAGVLSGGYGGGGGAGGYSGNGGNGGSGAVGTLGGAGVGGAGAGGTSGGGSGAGGGTAIFGQGANGQPQPGNPYKGGGVGSFGTGTAYSTTVGNPNGVGAGGFSANPVNQSTGQNGAVRIIYPGTTRFFPSTGTVDF